MNPPKFYQRHKRQWRQISIIKDIPIKNKRWTNNRQLETHRDYSSNLLTDEPNSSKTIAKIRMEKEYKNKSNEMVNLSKWSQSKAENDLCNGLKAKEEWKYQVRVKLKRWQTWEEKGKGGSGGNFWVNTSNPSQSIS